MSSTGPTSRNYERRLARQRQLELMEAAASGMPVDLMELDLSERSEEITFDHSTAENVRSSQSQPSSQRSSSVRSSAIFERGDAYSSRPAVNLMDHTTGIYEADEVKSGSSLLAGIFRVGGKKGRRSSADYPRDADEQDDEFSTLKTGGKGRLNPFGAACQRLWRTKYCLIAIILGSIAIICFVTILLVRTPEDVKHVQTEKTRLNNIMDFILDNGMGHIDHLVNNTNRAEYHALRWVAFTDGARLEPTDPYVLQRYSLATFFFGSFLKYQQVAGVQQLHEEEVWEDVPNPGWIRRDYWLSEKSHCLWYGVDCAAENTADNHFQPTGRYPDLGDVVGLKLRDNHIMGTIPPEFRALSALEIIDLSLNKLSGSLPREIGEMFALRQLVLENNKMTGAIPTTIGGMQAAQYLRLGANQFHGSLPTELARLSNLRHLSAPDNKLTGHLPNLDHSIRLASIWLDNNQIGGSLPPRWSLLDSLKELHVSKNQLTGSFPAELSSSRNLQSIVVDYNQINGTLANDYFDHLPSLELISMQHNQLSGPLPGSIGSLKKLKRLILNNNQFSGDMPTSESWASLKALSILHIHENQIQGILPDLSVSPALEEFWAYKNQLEGELPTSLGNCTNLETLYISHNQLKGDIPSELGNLKKLQELRMYDNDLEGSIPKQVCDLRTGKLMELEIDCHSVMCESNCCRCKDGRSRA